MQIIIKHNKKDIKAGDKIFAITYSYKDGLRKYHIKKAKVISFQISSTTHGNKIDSFLINIGGAISNCITEREMTLYNTKEEAEKRIIEMNDQYTKSKINVNKMDIRRMKKDIIKMQIENNKLIK